jgi:uncharacterized membrane protein YqhA
MLMLRRAFAASRYLIVTAVLGTFVTSLGLLFDELLVVVVALVDIVQMGNVSPRGAQVLAVALIETVDVFLIAVAFYITSLGLYALFVDSALPLPPWLRVNDLEDSRTIW